jgi:hypothetical protein
MKFRIEKRDLTIFNTRYRLMGKGKGIGNGITWTFIADTDRMEYCTCITRYLKYLKVKE